MRILGKTLTSDEMLLTAEGAAGVGMGLGMMFDPKKAHDKVFDKAKSTAMTRVAGASLAAASSYAMHAGYSGSSQERRSAFKIVALHSGIGAGLGLTQLAGSNGDKVMNKDKLKMATGVLALNSFFFAWRSVKRNSLL